MDFGGPGSTRGESPLLKSMVGAVRGTIIWILNDVIDDVSLHVACQLSFTMLQHGIILFRRSNFVIFRCERTHLLQTTWCQPLVLRSLLSLKDLFTSLPSTPYHQQVMTYAICYWRDFNPMNFTYIYRFTLILLLPEEVPSCLWLPLFL